MLKGWSRGHKILCSLEGPRAWTVSYNHRLCHVVNDNTLTGTGYRGIITNLVVELNSSSTVH
jgi:hypothetical protein